MSTPKLAQAPQKRHVGGRGVTSMWSLQAKPYLYWCTKPSDNALSQAAKDWTGSCSGRKPTHEIVLVRDQGDLSAANLPSSITDASLD